jgi:ATP-binding cassette subfamily F protein uup
MQVEAGEDSGRIVADLRDVRFAYAGRPVIEGLSTRVLRGDRVGILGPNGAGKSTLLRIILGELRPQGGRVVLGTRLEAAYFDQERGELELEKSVRHNLSGGSDYVQVRGRRRHVIGYLRDFLFPPERIDSPVQSLSGGERNRLLLAKILLARSNLLVLDEPTNDLDVETLELLEDLLADYEGTLLVVSHDRAFLDNVVTSLLVFEGDGRVGEYVGGYEDYLRQRGSGPAAAPAPAEAKDPAPAPTRARPPGASRAGKLSYKDQRELDALPGRIEALEGEVAGLEARISAPEFYRQDDSAAISATLARLESMRAELDAAYARWEQLEAGA